MDAKSMRPHAQAHTSMPDHRTRSIVAVARVGQRAIARSIVASARSPASLHGVALSHAAVAIFEPHDVVELGRRYFEHVGILERDHAVARARRDVHRVARTELANHRLLALRE